MTTDTIISKVWKERLEGHTVLIDMPCTTPFVCPRLSVLLRNFDVIVDEAKGDEAKGVKP